MITPTDKIGYIQRCLSPAKYRYVESKITRVNIGKKKTSVYSDRFNALDAEELESNTLYARHGLKDGFILVQEPFITDDELRKQAERWCENMNKELEDESNG